MVLPDLGLHHISRRIGIEQITLDGNARHAKSIFQHQI
jgi:hypothetical protein